MVKRTRAALWVCSGVMALATACGDDKPAREVDAVGDADGDGAEATPDGDATSESDGDATSGSDGDATSGSDGDATSESDADDGAETADADTADSASDTDIPADATPAQRAILGVAESERFELAGLTGPVHVVRTEGSTPHVYATNRNDLGRVLGFVQARDRFFFMDLQRRLGLGTLSELLGSLGLAQDIESRSTAMSYITDRIVAHISPEFAAYLTAYAAGVNAYIDAVRAGTLPAPTETQFAGVLGYASAADMMKPFALRDVVSLVAVFMYSTNFEAGDPGTQAAADRLAGQFEGVTDEALRKSGYLADIWNDVRGMFPDTNSTEGFGVGKSNAAPQRAAAGKSKRLPEGMAQKLYEKLQARLLRMGKDREAGFGSNVWAVSGDKTADGSALLANDGHLELSVPPLGYGAAMDTSVFGDGGIHQYGGWLGNFPVMIGGTNGDVAWGGVNPVMDITDWYREELQLDDDGALQASWFKGEWKPLVAVDETYVIANVPLLQSVGRSETWKRWTTFDGRWLTSIEGRRLATIDEAGEERAKVINVMGDLVIPGDTDGDKVITAISFDYVALDATKWPEALYQVGLSKDVDEVREATRGYVGSALFTGAADKHGNILFTSYQAVPCRGYLPRGGDGVFIEGADPTRLIDGTEYGGFTIPTDAAGKSDEGPGQTDPQKCVVPFDQMPYARNPPSGFIFSANNDPAGLTDDGEERNDAYHIGGPYASVRANTIRRDLRRVTAAGDATAAAMMEMQANIESRLGEAFVPYLETALAAAEAATEGPLAELQAAHGERFGEALERLDAWAVRGYHARSGVETFYASPSADDRDDAVATMIFNAYIRRFFGSVWNDEGITAERWGGEARPTALLRLLAGRGGNNPGALASWNPATGESVFFDVLGTEAKETSDQLMVQALADALAYLESPKTAPNDGGFGTTDMSQWLWGLRHQVRFESILKSYIGGNDALALITNKFAINTERIPLAANLTAADPRRGLEWFPRGGDQWSVDAANPGIGGGDFTYGSGPAMRLVFKLKDGNVEGHFVLPGGQSGLTDSPFFDDQAKLWLANDYLRVRFTPDEVATHATGREVYLPAP